MFSCKPLAFSNNSVATAGTERKRWYFFFRSVCLLSVAVLPYLEIRLCMPVPHFLLHPDFPCGLAFHYHNY